MSDGSIVHSEWQSKDDNPGCWAPHLSLLKSQGVDFTFVSHLARHMQRVKESEEDCCVDLREETEDGEGGEGTRHRWEVLITNESFALRRIRAHTVYYTKRKPQILALLQAIPQ